MRLSTTEPTTQQAINKIFDKQVTYDLVLTRAELLELICLLELRIEDLEYFSNEAYDNDDLIGASKWASRVGVLNEIKTYLEHVRITYSTSNGFAIPLTEKERRQATFKGE